MFGKRGLVVWVTALFLVAVIIGTVAWGETAQNIVRKYGSTGAYDLSSISQGHREAMGRVFFVDSSATNASDVADGRHGQSWNQPFATIKYAAVTAATANGGDTIKVGRNHTETISTAALGDLTVAGVYIEGEGEGYERPTVTVSGATSACFHLDGDHIVVRNLRFINGLADDTLVTMAKITGKYSGFENCGFYEGGADGDANGTTVILIGVADNDADYAFVKNCDIITPTTTNWAEAIQFAKDMKYVTISGNFIWGDYSNAGISIPAAGNAQVGLRIVDNFVCNTESGDHALEVNGTGNTGIVKGNTWCTNAAATAVDAGGLSLAGNFTSLYGTDQDFDEDPNGMPNSQ